VKTFIWLGVLFADVVRTPAFLWIGFWIGQQVLLNALTPRGSGGVAYLAHIGGFAAGAAIAGATLLVLKNLPASRKKREVDLDSKPTERRIFAPAAPDHGVEFVDDSGEDTRSSGSGTTPTTSRPSATSWPPSPARRHSTSSTGSSSPGG
jgi:hypothetical protein